MTLGEQVRADSQDPQLVALSESIHELSLVSTSYVGSRLAHTINFICNHIEDQSRNFINLPYNSDSALPFLNHMLSNAMIVSKDFQVKPRLVFCILTWKSPINRAQYNSWRCCSRMRRRLDRTRSEHSTPATPGGSFYLPPSDDSSSSEEISFDSTPATTKHEPKSKTTDPFNDYLRTRGISPIRSRLQRPWEEASTRTRRYYVRKAGQGLSHFYKT